MGDGGERGGVGRVPTVCSVFEERGEVGVLRGDGGREGVGEVSEQRLLPAQQQAGLIVGARSQRLLLQRLVPLQHVLLFRLPRGDVLHPLRHAARSVRDGHCASHAPPPPLHRSVVVQLSPRC